MLKYHERPYRLGVGAVLFNPEGRVWVGRRIQKNDQSISNFWQMPQGGIDEGENPSEAVFRELVEETGTDKADVIAETSVWLDYNLPETLADRSWGGKYQGQRQKWFALRFTGNETDFDLDRHHDPEFSEWKWVNLKDLTSMIVSFKVPMYSAIVSEFLHIPKLVTSST